MNTAEESRKRNAGQQRQNAQSRENTSNNQPNRKTGKASQPQGQPLNKTADSVTTSPALPPQEDHVPIAGFNASEVDSLLKKGFDANAPMYKAENVTVPKSQNPWAAKPGAMANGKEFFLELRKQVMTLKNGESMSKGG